MAFSMGYMSWLTSRFRNWVLGHIAVRFNGPLMLQCKAAAPALQQAALC